jgi:hypothetical protein
LVEPGRRGFLSVPPSNLPLRPLAETINNCRAYGNGEKRFYVHTGPMKEDGSIRLKVIEAVGSERSPYVVLCKLVLKPGTVRIEDIQNVYPGSEPDMGGVREVPLPEWRGLGFFPIILEHTMEMAAGKGMHRITIDPDNPDLGLYYSKFGFTPVPEKEIRMQLTF